MIKRPEEVVRMIGTTSGSRFRASERLAGKDRFNNGVVAYSSAISIIVSVYALIFHISPLFDGIIALFVIALSVTILAFSSLQYAGNYAVNAELMHRCALEINEIRRRLETREDLKPDEIQRELAEYDRILSKYPINHEEVDHWAFQLAKWWWFEDLNAELKRADGSLIGRVTPEEARKNRNTLKRKIFWSRHGAKIITLAIVAVLSAGAIIASSRLRDLMPGQASTPAVQSNHNPLENKAG